jgi:glycosyltransferase involved in cell wall biosynthesis
MLSPLVTFTKVPSLALVHTTAHGIIPNQIGDSPAKLFYLNAIKAFAMQRASVIVTVSHHAKGELSGLYPSARDRIRVIYHGIDHEVFRPLVHKPKPLNCMGIDRYLLSVSDRHVHKNYFRLIQAFALVCRNNAVTEHLVLVGRPKVADEEKRINELIASERLQGRVHLLEYAAQEQLAEIYRGASAYVFPSTFETFGFTPLEAMACGVPVACAWCSAMPEVCGDAVEYFDPTDIIDMANVIEFVLLNANRRPELVQMGERRASAFSWYRAAEQYYRVLSKIGKRA